MVSYELKLHIIETRGGAVFSGMVASENSSSVTLRQPDGELVVVMRSDIVKKTGTQKSIMPEGFERMIDEQSMAALLAFLRAPNKTWLTESDKSH